MYMQITRRACTAVTVLACLLSVTVASCGCGRSSMGTSSRGSGNTSGTLEFGGRQRTYELHLPRGYRGDKPVPLVMIFHGGLGNASNVTTTSGMNATADEHGFIAVYPDGTGALRTRRLTWNVLFGFGYALRKNVDDTGFIRALVLELERKYSIDGRRVYATGISNGGMLAYRVASDLSDVFAAVAPMEGAIGARRSPDTPTIVFPAPASPVSVIIFHGKQDRNVPYDGGKGLGPANAIYVPVRQAVDSWVAWDGCGPATPVTTSTDGNIAVNRYTGGKGGTEVRLVTIMNGGHTWPKGNDFPLGAGKGDEGEARPGPQTGSGNELMWQFFSEHPKSRGTTQLGNVVFHRLKMQHNNL